MGAIKLPERASQLPVGANKLSMRTSKAPVEAGDRASKLPVGAKENAYGKSKAPVGASY